MTERVAIILAAGKSTRMKSRLPKVLHTVGGRSMLEWSLALASDAGCRRTIVVIGTHSKTLDRRARELVGDENVVIQDPPQGTGHAVNAARTVLEDFGGTAVVLFADTPLIPDQAVTEAFESAESGTAVTVLGFEAADPGAYGRLITDSSGALDRIVEAKDASPAELDVSLCNSGVTAAKSSLLFDLLNEVTNDNAKGEYYLTDIVAIARARGLTNGVVRCAEADVLGVNSRSQLAEAELAFQTRKRTEHLEKGVTLRDPAQTYFSFDTDLAQDVTVEPGVVFGPGVTVSSGATILAYSQLEGCTIGPDAQIGPFARVRPGSEIGANVRIGNFVETKKTKMADGAKANHLAYLGDGVVGANANIGAGTIFCNYDGFNKWTTTVEEGAFVGSNSALVAPVTIGKGAFIGSGSVITKSVTGDALSVARGKQRDIEGWAASFRLKMSTKETD